MQYGANAAKDGCRVLSAGYRHSVSLVGDIKSTYWTAEGVNLRYVSSVWGWDFVVYLYCISGFCIEFADRNEMSFKRMCDMMMWWFLSWCMI